MEDTFWKIGRFSERVAKDFFSRAKQQNYDEIFSSSQEEETLWEDPEFPAELSSVFFSDEYSDREFEWKRPHVSVVLV